MKLLWHIAQLLHFEGWYYFLIVLTVALLVAFFDDMD